MPTSYCDLQPFISSPSIVASQCAAICRSLGIALPRSFGVCPGSSPGSVHASLLAWTSLSVRGCAQQRRPSPFLTWIFVCSLSTKVPTTLSMAVPPCLHTLVCGGSLDGVTILALVVVQLVILATHFLACSVMLRKGIWPTAYLRVLLSRTSVSNGVVGSLFLWILLLSGLATLGCSTQAPLTTLLPLLSCTSHLSGKCVNDFCHCSRSSAVPCQGLPSILLWVFLFLPLASSFASSLPRQGLPSNLLWVSFPFARTQPCRGFLVWSFSEAFVRAFSGSCTDVNHLTHAWSR